MSRPIVADPVVPALAIVADDITGAADVAGMLRRRGLRTALIAGDPVPGRAVPEADAVVVGLRIRTAPVAEAVERATAAARWLLDAAPAVLAWKICSTFDSTPAGNIGPVTDALLALTGLPAALVCPAFPENGRVVRDGRLFVHGVPLDESPMRDHPLTPMRDAELARLLAPQVTEPGRIVRIDTGDHPREAIEAAIAADARYLIPDAADDAAATALGEAVVGRALPVIASGLIPGIVAALRRAGRLPSEGIPPPAVPRLGGRAAIIAGSCSTATRAQVESFGAHHDVVRLQPDLADPPAAAIAAARRAFLAGSQAVLVASTADPAGVEASRETLGPEAGAWIEHWLGEVAAALAADGVRRFVSAGGETTGAVVEALNVRVFEVGAELAPGVPVLTADRGGAPLLLVAKSGNFGGPGFFERVLEATSATGAGDIRAPMPDGGVPSAAVGAVDG
ncbi:MAG TPA: 3-oxo-tetronate kinase [Candidatus Limnocylindrales bacterium]|nr:3-oxo-tetronate kinase [Candidatus Limnocylindrales bacterium]